MSDLSAYSRIERSITINAPKERVWRAISNAEEFGRWFGAELKGQSFAVGMRTRGRITQPGYEHSFFDVVIERMEPPNLLAFRWHPYSEPGTQISSEPMTLVVLSLRDGAGSKTVLTVEESGFDALIGQRRLRAWGTNDSGWEKQLKNVLRYVCS